KYADGYPGHRHYAGCEQADVAESLAIERACRLFGAGYANVQPYSGSQANLAAYLALLKPGETLLGMRPAHGGHRTHGALDNASGQIYDVAFYEVDALLVADIAHVAGLIAAGLYPTPVPLADLVTTTTHKTLRGPRGGMILA